MKKNTTIVKTKPKPKANPTIRQLLAFNEVVRRIETGTPIVWKEVMTKAGYTGTTLSRPQTLYKAPAFRELMSFIDDKVILGRLYQILMDDDKRSSLTAADMLLKLKDRYPANKLKVTAYQESLDDL